MSESLGRWPHAQGTVRLSEVFAWQDRRALAQLETREKREIREVRARRAAQNRAWRRWRHALAVAGRLGVLYAGARPSAAAVSTWQEIAAAVAECARLRTPGAEWQRELVKAEARLVELTPQRLDRAEWRRQLREERKRATTYHGEHGQR